MAENINISPEMVENLINMFNNNKSNSTSNSANSTKSTDFSNNLDIESIMKIKSILDSLNNTSNKDTNLLYSLKPYLRRSRQNKIDQYINILKISQVSKIFRDGDIKL